MSAARPRWLSILPIPLLAVLIFVLDLDIDPAVAYDPPWLILVGNTLFITAAFLVVSFIALRNYLATGRVQVLFLGCGVLAFAVGAVAAAAVRGLPDGANLNVTIYNTSALLAALFHFAAAFLLVAGISPETGARRRGAWLALGYGGSVVLVAALVLAALRGWTPPFKVSGSLGFTPLRQAVLGSADALFGFSCVTFAAMHLRNREKFLHWYASALALTAVSLTAFFVQASVGSPVGWAGRISQYLAGAYFLASMITVGRAAQARRLPLVEALAASLTGSEEKFRALAENVPDAIRRFDAQVRHLYANPACRKLYQRPALSLIGRGIREVGLPPQKAAEWEARVREVFRTGERLEVEEEYESDDGDRFFLSSCVPERGTDGSVANVLVVSRDLTLRRRAERALQASEERYRRLSHQLEAVLDAAPAIIWTAHDSACRSITGNMAAQVFSRVSPDTDMSKTGPRPDLLEHYRVFLDGRELAPQEMPMQRVAATGRPIRECEVEFRFDGGEVRFLLGNVEPLRDPHGAPAGAIAAFVDITEHKRASTALKDQYARLETLSHVVAVLLVERDPQKALERLARRVMDVLDCQVFFNFLLVAVEGRLRLNACAGIPPEEAAKIQWLDRGTTVCGCVAQEGRRIVVEEVQRSTEPRDQLVRGYGVRAYACHPLLSTAGAVIGTLSFGARTRDRFSDDDLAYMKTVTDHLAIAIERRRAQEELEKLNETLEQRVAERTREARALAGELRTLAVELSRAEQRERRRLATILHDHVQQLLVAARMKAERLDPRRDPVKAESSARDVVALLEETLEASRSLTIELCPPVLKQAGLLAGLRWLADRMSERHQFTVEVHARAEAEPDREEIRFLLFECTRELLFNSLKHSGVRRAAVQLSRTGDRSLEVVVQDEGRGFVPLVGARKGGSITAFGLFSIEQRLAHLGGTLVVDSAPGGGARVRMVVPPPPPPLPVCAGAPPAAVPEAAAAAEAAPAACRGGRIRVLMVDDNRNLREGLSELLGMESDIEIVGGAATGPQAIQLAQQLQPDVVAMDLNLGGMDGIEATRIIVRSNPGVKVIGLSMYLEEDIARSMREAGAAAYVSKGGPTRDIADAIRACRRPG